MMAVTSCPLNNEEFVIEVGNGALEFKTLKLADPMPTGRQVIEGAGFRPAEQYLLFELCHGHQPIELELDQTTDIEGHPKETKRFLIFKSDRSWRGVIDGNRFEWGAGDIYGRVLKHLAGVNPETHGVWLERRGEPDRLIADDEKASLSSAAVERFYTAKLIQICIEGTLFPWEGETITTEEIAQLGGWDVSIGVIEVDADENERNLKPGETIKLEPGLSFGKKLRFKRGQQ